jgi:hypothetical protein
MNGRIAMSSTHTPTPWHIEDGIYIKAGFQHVVKSTDDSGRERANLAFIVRAVNGYEAMKEALEQYRFLHGNDPVAERIGSKPYCDCQQCKLSYKALALTTNLEGKAVQK